MEPQVTICCNKKERKTLNCINIVIFLISILLTFTIGLIVGITAASTLIGNLAVIIASAVILFVLLIIFIILLLCNEKKRC